MYQPGQLLEARGRATCSVPRAPAAGAGTIDVAFPDIRIKEAELDITDKAMVRNLLASAMHQCPVVYGRTCARCVKHEGELYCLADVESVRLIDSMMRYERVKELDGYRVVSVPKVEPPKGCPHAERRVSPRTVEAL